MHNLPACILTSLAVVAISVSFADGQELAKAGDPEWLLNFRYGGGIPKDPGPLGHCTATFTKSGKVRIESKRYKNDNATQLSEVVIYEKEMLDREQLEVIFKAADEALKEPKFKSNGHNEDGCYLKLERSGNDSAKIIHSQMDGFSHAPPAMQKFIELINKLLPAKERIPLRGRSN